MERSKKTVVRILGLLITLSLVLTMFAGCGASKDGGSASTASAAASTVATADASTTAEPEAAVPSYSKDKTPITLSWYVNESFFTWKWTPGRQAEQMILDRTGVTLDISTSVGSNGSEKLNAMIAADNLPDIVTTSRYNADFKSLQATGRFQPLMPLVEKYAPDFKKDIPPAMVGAYTQPDGNWYAYLNAFWDTSKLEQNGIKLHTNLGMVARKDIMDKLGIKKEDFDTEEGLYQALKKVKGYKYNGANVTPFFSMNDMQEFIYQYSGVPYEDANGNYVDTRKDPRILDRIKFANKLYREGLITSDSFTVTGQAEIGQLVIAGNVFCFDGSTRNYDFTKLNDADPNASYISVGPTKGKDNLHPYMVSEGMLGWEGTMISTKCKAPDRAIRLMQYLSTPEAFALTWYGVEGKQFTYDEQGRVQMLPEWQAVLDKDLLKAREQIGLDCWLMFDAVTEYKLKPKPVSKLDVMQTGLWDYNAPYVYDETAFSLIDPAAGSPEATIKVKTDAAFVVPKMVMADSEAQCEALYNESIAKMDKLGWQKLYDYQNAEFQKVKKNLGIKFAWPSLQ